MNIFDEKIEDKHKNCRFWIDGVDKDGWEIIKYEPASENELKQKLSEDKTC